MQKGHVIIRKILTISHKKKTELSKSLPLISIIQTHAVTSEGTLTAQWGPWMRLNRYGYAT